MNNAETKLTELPEPQARALLWAQKCDIESEEQLRARLTACGVLPDDIVEIVVWTCHVCGFQIRATIRLENGAEITA